ncbi:hypothetical protein PINS_up020993 [Pythium insidiosum]|nr:hypothetical protein PINS_up020993 [Pythium insidiosum]
MTGPLKLDIDLLLHDVDVAVIDLFTSDDKKKSTDVAPLKEEELPQPQPQPPQPPSASSPTLIGLAPFDDAAVWSLLSGEPARLSSESKNKASFHLPVSKEEARKLKNRRAAARSRQRSREKLLRLERLTVQLMARNHLLEAELQQLQMHHFHHQQHRRRLAQQQQQQQQQLQAAHLATDLQ